MKASEADFQDPAWVLDRHGEIKSGVIVDARGMWRWYALSADLSDAMRSAVQRAHADGRLPKGALIGADGRLTVRVVLEGEAMTNDPILHPEVQRALAHFKAQVG